ncbi:MAG TPA: hypothetical protein VFL87_07075 [Thermoleophilaceae bacterium]|nr:hypothetical protein [Thermoleophilaceae bacterium]
MADMTHEVAVPLQAPAVEAPEFEIVPVRALPAVAVVLGLLIATIAADWGWGLDFFHVVAGGLWTAIDLFVGFIVGPIIGRLSIPARMEFSKRFMPKMLLLMPTLVICTLASGWQLGHHLGFTDASYFRHGWIVASYIVVGVMSVVALAILEPANLAVLFELKKPRPNGELIGRLMRRFIYTAGVTGAMQIATLIIMTRIASA